MPRPRLIEAREKAGLTQKDVADRLGITRSHYTKIEQGSRDPSLDVLQKICGLLGTRPEDLFLAHPGDTQSRTGCSHA